MTYAKNVIFACLSAALNASSCEATDEVFIVKKMDLVQINRLSDTVRFIVYNIDGSIKSNYPIPPFDSLLFEPFAQVPNLPIPFGNSAGDSIKLVSSDLGCRVYYRNQSTSDRGAGEGPFGLHNYDGYDATRQPGDQPEVYYFVIDSLNFIQGRACVR